MAEMVADRAGSDGQNGRTTAPVAVPAIGTQMQPCIGKVAGQFRYSESERCWVLWQ